jgi:hypothetical protein
MTRPPRIPLALLERFVPDSAPLAGDLVEEFARRQSRAWFWRQVLAAIAAAGFERSPEIRPLQLVDLQPADALDRARRLNLRFPPLNLTASPLPDIGGVGIVLLACHLSFTAPAAWWALAASTVAGVSLGVVLILVHAHATDAPMTSAGPSILPR